VAMALLVECKGLRSPSEHGHSISPERGHAHGELGCLLAGASSSSLLEGASGSSLLAGASSSSLLAGASGSSLLAGASRSSLLAGASGSSLLAGASGFLVEELLYAAGVGGVGQISRR
jgi:hypothetical protein